MSTATTDLDLIGRKFQAELAKPTRRVLICAGTGCVANGALKVYDAFVKESAAAGVKVITELKDDDSNQGVLVSKGGCPGYCQIGPLVTILPENILYTRVRVEDVPEIVAKTLAKGAVIDRLLYVDPATGEKCTSSAEIPFYKRQALFVLKQCGAIDPEDIREYIHIGGYAAARKAYLEMTPQQICEEITHSGLRGRGGGGFPTGKKWDVARRQPDGKKYVICNGDEGDPGAFMNRSVMESNPHAVIEGLMIAGRAIGSDEAYIYVRAEYPLAVKRLRKAVADAERIGVLGPNVFGSGMGFKCVVMEGAGAFVCGEETALIHSSEGQRGMPSPKPPFPAQSGLWGKPTVINNVESLATVPLILTVGAREYRSRGTPGSPGTKTFALTGHVANCGLIEVPFGTTVREIVFGIGGGITDDLGKTNGVGFKAVQIGGPSGGCLTEEHLDLPLDYDSLRAAGAMVGSGGLVVMNKNTCMVSVARFFMEFIQNESCGKCVLCREGTKQMLALLDDIVAGRATAETLELLQRLAVAVGKGSLCGLGKTAPNPVLSTMRAFRAEYEAHVFQKRCPAGRCKALMAPKIDPTLCKGCTLCAKKCPVNAISGEKGKPHRIDDALCTKCGTCVNLCKFKAISGV